MSDNNDIVFVLREIRDNQVTQLEVLRGIRDNQAAPPFNIGIAICAAIAVGLSLVLALAISDFMIKLFALIPVGSSGLLGAAIYMVIAFVLVMLFLFIIYIYLQPWLSCKLKNTGKGYICSK